MSVLPLVSNRSYAHDDVMKKLLGALFTAGLALNARLTRSPLRALETRLTTPFFVRLTRLIRDNPAEPVAPTAEALGQEWRRLLGNPRSMPIVQVDESTGTAYGEILVHCPLRGTGDVEACHRLMAYDRGLLKPMGAHLVVLQSQAEPGHTHCRVALTWSSGPLSASGSIPIAHEVRT